MPSAFDVIAEPTRRAILSLLGQSDQTVKQIQERLSLSQPTVSKHLRVLRDGGFVESKVDAQHRVYRLRAQPLVEVDQWLRPFRALWKDHLDALELHLDQQQETQP